MAAHHHDNTGNPGNPGVSAVTEVPKATSPVSGARVWRGSAAGRGVEVGSLPARWFPADRAKLIYLAVASHAGPQVLAELVRVPEGAWLESPAALVEALEQAPAPTA